MDDAETFAMIDIAVTDSKTWIHFYSIFFKRLFRNKDMCMIYLTDVPRLYFCNVWNYSSVIFDLAFKANRTKIMTHLTYFPTIFVSYLSIFSLPFQLIFYFYFIKWKRFGETGKDLK